MLPEAVTRVLAAVSEARSFDDFGRVIVDACAREFDAEVCSVWRRYKDDTGADRLRLMAATAKAPQSLAAEVTYALREDDPNGKHADGVTGYIAQTRKQVHVLSHAQLTQEYRHCWKGRCDRFQWDDEPKRKFRSLYGVPLVLGERLVGVLKLENKRDSRKGFPKCDRDAIRTLAPYIALAVHTFGMLEPHDLLLIQVPAKMVDALLRPFDPKELVGEIVRTVAESLHAELCSLWLVDPGENVLRLADGYGFDAAARTQQTYRLCDPAEPDARIDGLTAWVAVRKRPFWENSWKELKRHPSWRGKWDKEQWPKGGPTFRCMYAIPLLRGDTVVGVLKVENRRDAAFFTDSDRALCGIMASLIVLVLDLGQLLRISLLSDLAHLIRSPIGQVSMNLSGLEQELKNLESGGQFRFDRAQRYLDFIKKSLMAVSVTSRTLAAHAKKSVFAPDATQREDVVLSELVSGRIREVTPLLYGGIRIELDTRAANDAAVRLDVTERTQVQIVIDNILHNAIKYSKSNSTVRVRLQRKGSTAILSIVDVGCGIARADLPRVFEPGFTRRAPAHPEGTGMGLTTVKQVLDKFGWKYELRSVTGKGTTFRVLVPLVHGD